MTLEAAKEALKRYAKNRCAPGNFLTGILENDLRHTLRSADPESLENLPAIFRHAWETLPSNIWGSPRAVVRHLENKPAAQESVWA